MTHRATLNPPGLHLPFKIVRNEPPRLDAEREARIARHLAWCELMHRERLAACADLGKHGAPI
jgi:hypothetical protein